MSLVRAAIMSASILAALGAGAPGARGDDCPNAQFRQGFSSALPDCRAYELVTPRDTNGVLLQATYAGSDAGRFPYQPAAANGNDVIFSSAVGSLPGLPAAQGNGESYQGSRGANGWSVSNVSPTFAEAHRAGAGPFPGDHHEALWRVVDGSLDFNPVHESPFFGSTVLRHGDGSYEPLGRGSLGDDPNASAILATSGGGHLIFRTGAVRAGFLVPAVQLEPEAPAAPTFALYDRTGDGATHVVSLLPGSKTPEAGENAYAAGASADGSVVLFCLNAEEPNGSARCETNTTLYARVDNSITETVTTGLWIPAGVSSDGDRVFYVEGGNIFSFDTTTQSTAQVNVSGDALPVNVSADGSHVFFVSPSQLDGAEGVPGASNLYVWEEAGGETHFIATLAEADITGEVSLAQWPRAAGVDGEVSRDPSRSTADGTVLVFESAAQLTPYDNEGRVEIYRYDAIGRTLSCPSCRADGLPPLGDAHLQNDPRSLLIVLDSSVVTNNLSEDGNHLFFETVDALAQGDVNGAQDVYEWRAAGTGDCEQAGGCPELISSGHSARAQNPPVLGGEERPTNFLYGATPDGHDVFFLTRDALVPGASAGDLALYDARVGGGFAQPRSASCSGDGCQGQPAPAPGLATSASSSFVGHGNAKPKRCRKRHRHRCQRRKHRHRHQHRSRGGLRKGGNGR
jgi:hypothetical protein